MPQCAQNSCKIKNKSSCFWLLQTLVKPYIWLQTHHRASRPLLWWLDIETATRTNRISCNLTTERSRTFGYVTARECFWNILRTCAPLPPLTGQGDCSTIALDLERRFAGWKQRRALVRQRTVVMLNVGLWHHFSKIPYSSFGFINRACYALTSSFNHQHVLCFNMTTPNQ